MEEVKNEEIEVLETPKYVYEDALEDILSLNKINEDIENKEKEKEAKEEEVKKAEENKKNKADEIGIINTGDHIEEVTYNLNIYNELNEELKKQRRELDDIYSELRQLESNKMELDKGAREKVEEFTKIYNEKKEEHIRLTDGLLNNFTPEGIKKVNELADEIKKFKKFASFEDILKSGKTIEEEKKEELVGENKEEVSELTEVKVNEIDIPEEENKLTTEVEVTAPVEEEKKEETVVDTPIVPEVPVSEPVRETPVVPETPAESIPEVSTPVDKISIPSFEELLGDTKVEPKKEEQTVFLGKNDKIADSNNKGINATIDAFNPKKVKSEDKTLTLAV